MSKAIIFDFDGTLVDSEKAIYECFQSITKLIAPERRNFAKNILIGPPLRDTASEILGPKNQDQLNKFINLFIEMHDEKAIKHTKPYPDVVNVLHALNKNNVLMAIATNKRQIPSIKLIDYFGWEDYFKFIECSDSQKQIRNKDQMIQDIINQDNSFCEAYFIGDTVNDGLSANLSQLPFIKACYGYGGNQDWSNVTIAEKIDNLHEILNL
ncbi:HAD family hydrolase [Methylophilaceae bacterium]|nr:HAD family hydrolase [Methylophilaceae bacterium]